MFFYVEPGEENAVAKAFRKCGERMNIEGVPQAGIVVPQISNLEGFISEVLGDTAVKALAKNKVLRLNPESIHLFTKRQPPRAFKGPLLVAFTPVEQLKAVIRDNPKADIVFVPWAPDERDFFVKSYSAELI